MKHAVWYNTCISILIIASSARAAQIKKAFITGVTGQDGSYLAELLLDKGYEVHGLKRRSSSYTIDRIAHLVQHKRFKLHYGDVTDAGSMMHLMSEIQPDEIYNLAAQSHVLVSFETPLYTAHADGIGTLIILDSIRLLKLEDKTRFYQASTSEMFGKVQEIPQSEATPFYPRSPYGAAKLYAHWITVNYRESYQIFACSGILFNHESPRRGEHFVTRKITQAVARITCGLQDTPLHLGNLDAKRDWGYAKDYVEAMWLMLQQDHPEDFVIATGETRSVREFVEAAFKEGGITVIWQGSGVQEKGIDAQTGKVLVAIDSRYFRPAEVDLLIGNPAKAARILNWKPKTSFQELVKIMVQHDIELLKKAHAA